MVATTNGSALRADWQHAARGASALAVGMGVGRFAYTPILPLMTAQAGLTASAGASLATANYVGNLAGALVGMLAPRLGRSVVLHRAALVLLVATLAAMPCATGVPWWFALRLLAGAASGVVFVFAANSVLGHLRDHLPGWGFSGVGAGIALSGAVVLVLRAAGNWRSAWIVMAVLGLVLAAAAWRLPPPPEPGGVVAAERPRTHRWFSALFVSYSLEGVGYIIAGTFLVAAIGQGSPGSLGAAAWVLVGLAAVPSSIGWAWLGRRWTRPGLLLAALLVQAVGIALPALSGGVVAALVAAVLFGATFLGVSTVALGTGTHLRFPRAVALLTAGYSAGQILGPLVVAPLLHHGYRPALVLGALIVFASAVAAALLRIGFPHEGPQ
ncbi:Predicted arabinose efflux permease, MFS family [Amycolatopsis sacchari]|uniref:Predicted arabinose efflux permease, MFS family n=1 Tax=Amycolatopsis sacchari TaxID=115433 RepID=A0A1I3QIV5_9PSEU|nr:YbfB/YjiJ family MFS transporter [Amycolatopsis sacchari]SFJ33482.1 Predicted arabinose efflux permease, MFS family [Amycolatopsis sacchari]